MSPLVMVAIVAVAIGLTIRSARRSIGDRNTLEAHHRALDTLADMAAHRTGPPLPGAEVRRATGPTAARSPQRRRPGAAPAHRTVDRSPATRRPAARGHGRPGRPPAGAGRPGGPGRRPEEADWAGPPPAAGDWSATSPAAGDWSGAPTTETDGPARRPEEADWSGTPPAAGDWSATSPAAGDWSGAPTTDWSARPPAEPGRRRGADPAALQLAPPMPAAQLVAQSLGASGVMRRQRPAHRRRSVPPVVLVTVGAATVAVLVLAVGLTLAVGRNHSTSSHRPATPAAAPAPTPPTTASAPVVFSSGDGQEARFQVARTGANIELVATSSCWVQIRTGSATGPAVFTGTLHRGDRRPVPAGQAVFLRMGNPPGLSVEVNGSPLAFPAPSSSQPFNLVFQPNA